MKRALVLLLTICLTTAAFAAGDILSELRVSAENAKESVLSAFSYGSASLDPAKNVFKAAPPAVRAKLVQSALAWAKAYTSTAEFKQAYAARRNEAKPQPPTVTSVDAELKRQQAEQLASIADSRKSLKEVPAEMRAELEKSIAEAERAVKEMQSDKEQQQMMREGIAQQIADDKARHQEELQRWNEEYPADPRVLIKRRLDEFLAVSATVDYDAKLVSRYGKMQFANPDYESQSSDWKMCYRAGKEAVAAARAFAQQWAGEL